MRRPLVDLLRSPVSGQRLELRDAVERDGEIESGTLVTADGARSYPIHDFIPRFVPTDNYAASFGMQWLRFRGTQLDSVSGVPISRDRFYRFSGWTPEDLRGKRVLDVGCGAGRFAEIALQAGAQVVALDYSGAVDAARANLSSYTDLEVIQGDIYAMPFALGQFDFVYCLGVLQHTPDVEQAFRALPPQLKPGGRLVVDVYPWLLRNVFWSKYWLRPITKRMEAETLFAAVRGAAPALLGLSRRVSKIPIGGRYLRYLIPVVNYEGTYPLSEAQLREWAVLDTFDMLAPAHDHPQRLKTLRRWLDDSGLDETSVEHLGFFVGRGICTGGPRARGAG